MDESLPVDRCQGPEHRNHHIQGLLGADPAPCVRDVGLEGDALNVVHDEIGRLILVKVIRHARNVRLAHELCKGAGLLLKTLLPVGKVLCPLRGHDGDRGSLQAGRHLPGHVLLHRHTGGKLLIPGHVGDAKASLAQHPAHEISVI